LGRRGAGAAIAVGDSRQPAELESFAAGFEMGRRADFFLKVLIIRALLSN
jgi:hypothetical protein